VPHRVLGPTSLRAHPDGEPPPLQRSERRLVSGVIPRVEDHPRAGAKPRRQPLGDPPCRPPLVPVDARQELEDVLSRQGREARRVSPQSGCHARQLLPQVARHPPVMEADRESFALEKGPGEAMELPRQGAYRRPDPGGSRSGFGMPESNTRPLDLQAVAAPVDHPCQTDPAPDVGKRPAREDRKPHPRAFRKLPKGLPDGGRESGGLGPGDDRRQGAVVVQNQDETGPPDELAPEALSEPAREAQDALAPSTSSGIRASSLRSRPAHR